jgi:hypothetical protein
MGDPLAFEELIGLITTHPALWAVNLGELSTTFSGDQHDKLLAAVSRSQIACTYYDQGGKGSTLPAYCKALIDSTRNNRKKHTRWSCGDGGEGDARVIMACHGMFRHPRLFRPNAGVFNSRLPSNLE